MPTELADAEWIMREPGSGTRSEFEVAIAAASTAARTASLDGSSITILSADGSIPATRLQSIGAAGQPELR